jgi:hypothetical protein
LAVRPRSTLFVAARGASSCDGANWNAISHIASCTRPPTTPSMSSEELATPMSRASVKERYPMTPGAPVCSGSCKKTKCKKSCKLVFSGNALRIRSHYIE